MVEELWLRAFIAEVVVVVEVVSLTQLPTPPTLPILHPHALFLGLFNLTPIFGLLAHPHAQVSLTAGMFILTQRLMVCSSPPMAC